MTVLGPLHSISSTSIYSIYCPVEKVLQAIMERMSPGGIVVIAA
jgi:hypothetical protein